MFSWLKRTFMIQVVLALGRAVNLGYRASGFLRLSRRAVRKLAWLTLIPTSTKPNTKVPTNRYQLKTTI